LHARRQCKTYLPNKSKSETHARQGEMVKCFIRLRRAHVPVFAARPISYACMCYTVTSLSHKRGGSLGLGKRCDAHLSRLAWEGVRSGTCGRRYQLSCDTVGCCSVRPGFIPRQEQMFIVVLRSRKSFGVVKWLRHFGRWALREEKGIGGVLFRSLVKECKSG